MRVLVIGQGGREHALTRALLLSPSVTEVHAIPGHDGMRKQCLCHDFSMNDSDAIIQFCLRAEIDVVVIGPEDPLAQGLADHLRERGILVVGPSRAAAQLEASKIFAKEFMKAAKIPTASFEVVKSVGELMIAAQKFSPPFVLKADGLAAGKGVFICADLAELKKNGEEIFEKNKLGAAGSKAVLEEFTKGWEVSYIILTNGQDFSVLPLAQDHKRLLDHGQGPNTGGMGTVAPLRLPAGLDTLIREKIVSPTLQEMRSRGMLYRGFLFFGLMISPKGPSLLEFNCRLGDPETQVILPLLEGDFGLMMKQVAQGQMPVLFQKNLFSACVVMTGEGYPDRALEKTPIDGDLFFETENSYFIHAGTSMDADSGKWYTRSGRVLGAVGVGQSLREALKAAYAQTEKVTWKGLHFRKDIGADLEKHSG